MTLIGQEKRRPNAQRLRQSGMGDVQRRFGGRPLLRHGARRRRRHVNIGALEDEFVQAKTRILRRVARLKMRVCNRQRLVAGALGREFGGAGDKGACPVCAGGLGRRQPARARQMRLSRQILKIGEVETRRRGIPSHAAADLVKAQRIFFFVAKLDFPRAQAKARDEALQHALVIAVHVQLKRHRRVGLNGGAGSAKEIDLVET